MVVHQYRWIIERLLVLVVIEERVQGSHRKGTVRHSLQQTGNWFGRSYILCTMLKASRPHPNFCSCSTLRRFRASVGRQKRRPSCRRSTVIAGPWPVHDIHCPASSSALTKTSVALAVVQNAYRKTDGKECMNVYNRIKPKS